MTTGLLRTTLVGIDTARLARHALSGRATRGPRQRTASASTSRCALPALVARWRSLSHPRSRQWSRRTGGASPSEPGTSSRRREWLLTWWRHYGKARRQLIGLARAGGDLVAIVPLYEWWRHGIPVLRFVGHGPSDQLGPICAPLSRRGRSTSVVAQTLDAVPLRRFVLLAEQVAGDQRFGDLTGARSLYREASPVLRFEHDSWDEFLRARGRNFRQQAASLSAQAVRAWERVVPSRH